MKKKILIVFLICCMLLGVSSPAFAYGDMPDLNAWDYEEYIVFPVGDFFVYGDSDFTDLCFMIASDYPISTDSVLVNLLSDGSIDKIYFPNTSNYDSLNIYYYGWSPSLSTWKQFVSIGTYESDLEGYSCLDFISSSCFPSNTITITSVSSTVPLKVKGTNENFPPAPPLVNLTEELIQKTPEALDLDGKLKILVPFGISCLVLLISLPLLLKVLRRFLV